MIFSLELGIELGVVNVVVLFFEFEIVVFKIKYISANVLI